MGVARVNVGTDAVPDWRNIGCGGADGTPGRLKMWDGGQWLVEACDDEIGGHPLKALIDGTWVTVACMVPDTTAYNADVTAWIEPNSDSAGIVFNYLDETTYKLWDFRSGNNTAYDYYSEAGQVGATDFGHGIGEAGALIRVQYDATTGECVMSINGAVARTAMMTPAALGNQVGVQFSNGTASKVRSFGRTGAVDELERADETPIGAPYSVTAVGGGTGSASLVDGKMITSINGTIVLLQPTSPTGGGGSVTTAPFGTSPFGSAPFGGSA